MNDLPTLKPTRWRWVFAFIAAAFGLAMGLGAFAAVAYIDRHVGVVPSSVCR